MTVQVNFIKPDVRDLKQYKKRQSFYKSFWFWKRVIFHKKVIYVNI